MLPASRALLSLFVCRMQTHPPPVQLLKPGRNCVHVRLVRRPVAPEPLHEVRPAQVQHAQLRQGGELGQRVSRRQRVAVRLKGVGAIEEASAAGRKEARK